MVKVQVPMDKDVRDTLKAKAKDYGFDSLQAYMRVLTKADADGRKINLEIDDWGEPSPEAAARLNKAAEEARRSVNVSGPYYSVDDFMKDL